MKLIPFKTNNFTDDTHFMVSNEDYEKVSQHDWIVAVARTKKDINKGQRQQYRIIRHSKKQDILEGWPTIIMVHRYIKNLKNKEDRKIIVDHKNGWLDNTNESLRLCTNTENVRYQKRQLNKKSKLPKGIYMHKDGRKRPYRAQIVYNNEHIVIGDFVTLKEAHSAYCSAADRYFGEFSKYD